MSSQTVPYLNASDEVSHKIKAGLHTAAEIACGNVPELPGSVIVGLDTSGSMSCPITGNRGRGATSRMRCIDVAASVTPCSTLSLLTWETTRTVLSQKWSRSSFSSLDP